MVAAAVSPALALITGGEGNEPHSDPGWPAGAAKIFNHEGRIAWWEGPPFGGGQWTAECRGNAKTFSDVLADFVKVDSKNKRVVIHDGTSRSFWLDPNRTGEKAENALVDWTFSVWEPDHWKRLRQLPADINPTSGEDEEKGPPIVINVYTGGNIKWADVKVPKEIEIDDQRLEAHGYKVSDGVVFEGVVSDAETGKPIAGAKIKLELIEPQKMGGYKYTVTKEAAADDAGKWVIKNTPEGWFRIYAEAKGYAPRVIGHTRYDSQPQWHRFSANLTKPTSVTGRVMDPDGKPIADVEVRLSDVADKTGRYESPSDYKMRTDAEGKFKFDSVPIGSASVWIHKQGFVRPGLGPKITTPAKDVDLTMYQSAQLVVTVAFAAVARDGGYIVNIEPEGGGGVGTWGGSGNIDDKNQITFKDVPPGKYVLFGRPNPGSVKQETEKVTVELKGGKTVNVTLTAR
jgi:protocatechuate 3,4-dioxygenase beta subunit